jgi:TM2 domain-containing membrane protein YozV
LARKGVRAIIQANTRGGRPLRYNVVVAYLLWLLSGFGVLGFHRFYLGKIPTGILWMCTAGLGGFGAFYDLLTLPRQVWTRNAIADATRGAYAAEFEREAPRREPLKESLEHVILRTARRNGGAVTAGEVALEGDVAIEEARKELDRLASRNHAEMRVRSSGVVVYVFPEFADPGPTGSGKDDYIA